MSSLLDRLRKYKDNRGMLANLKCVLVESKKQRAWPALNRLGVEIKDNVSAYIAGLYATHPEETLTGNFGATCAAIESKRGETRGEKLTPTERRFQHLLAAEPGAELQSRVLRMVLMAKSQGLSINYGQLEIDLRFWGERTRTEWASSFWAQGAPSVDGEVA